MNDQHPNAPGNEPERDTQPNSRRVEPLEVQAPVPALAEQTLAVDLARVEIDQLIATAHRFPRQIKVALAKLDQLVLMDEAAAENSIYVLPRGGKAIPGPSIGFANTVASCWGNCWDYGRWIGTDRREKVVICEGIFVDWETNRRTVVSDQRRIVDSKGRLYNDDMIIITSKACSSIARRNVILNAVPRQLWYPTFEKALYIVRGSEATLGERRDAAFKALMQYGIKAAQVLMFLGVGQLNDVGVEHMPTLRGMYAQLRDGSITPEEMFDPRRMTSGGIEAIGDPLGEADDEPAGRTATPASEPTGKAAASDSRPSDAKLQATNGEKPAAADQFAKAKAKTEAKQEAANKGAKIDTAQEARREPAGETSADPMSDAPRAVNANTEPAREADGGAGAETVFEKPYVRKTGAEYLAYLQAWTAAATKPGVRDRYRGERDMRNALGVPLNEDQLDEAAKIMTAAEKRLATP